MTVIDQLRAGNVPGRISKIAADEGVEIDRLVGAVLCGRIVVPQNRLWRTEPLGIGEGLKIKVNANIGTSAEFADVDEEILKAKTALSAGADTLMDLSTGGDIAAARRAVRVAWPKPFGTVPVYQALVEAYSRGGMVEATVDTLFDVVVEQAKDGVDFFTIHAGVTRGVLDVLAANKRVTGIVSRGGAFMAAWMLRHDSENPFYSDFDRLLDLLAEYDVTLSLGDGLRPGALADATDAAQIAELRTLGELVKRARERGVQVIVEGPGHVPLDQVAQNVRLEKEIADGAPFYVLGPLVIDVGAGHDHIAGAIGGAVAGMAGADFLCYVTPREHLGLPTAQDVRTGVIASRIAAHAVDIVRRPELADWDRAMATARKALNWERQLDLALDSEEARRSYEARRGSTEACTMCSGYCAMKLVADYLEADDFAGCCMA